MPNVYFIVSENCSDNRHTTSDIVILASGDVILAHYGMHLLGHSKGHEAYTLACYSDKNRPTPDSEAVTCQIGA